MVNTGAGVEEQPKSAPKPAAAGVPKRRSPQNIPTRLSEALANRYEARTAQEVEDHQRLELADRRRHRRCAIEHMERQERSEHPCSDR